MAGEREYRQLLGASAGMDGARSPSSKRSSGFWGMEVGWDCCHEVSAESGEGVEEVFRVITRKLVEQNMKQQQQAANAANGLMSPGSVSIPGGEGGEGYFDHMRNGGSFRVGRDRRSWLGFPTEVQVDGEEGGTETGKQGAGRRRCC